MADPCFEWQVAKSDEGMNLVQFLKARLPKSHSARYIKSLVGQAGCLVNGRVERFGSRRLLCGEKIRFSLPQQRIVFQIKFESSRILYEDEDILCYDKPPGIACDARGIEAVIQAYRQDLHLVHRLDGDTSGALLFATHVSLNSLQTAFRQRRVFKEYDALVDGRLTGKGVVDASLQRVGKFSGGSMMGLAKNGQSALTEWAMHAFTGKASWVICRPQTGRTHQLRVHLAHLGHPILGDYQYGRVFCSDLYPARQMLHARRLQFPHLTAQKLLDITAPLPQDFLSFWQDIRGKKT